MQTATTSILTLLAFICYSSVSFADEIKLHKKGATVKFNQDMHCMTNTTALSVLEKVKFCSESCKIKLDGQVRECDTKISGLEAQLLNQKSMYLKIIQEKEKSIIKIQSGAIDLMSKSESSIWWKVTVAVVGGVVVGAATTATIMHLTR